MREYTIYLVGQISDNIETYNWRKNVIQELKDYENVRIINPCNSEFNRTIEGDKDLFAKWQRVATANLLVPKDRNHVKESDCILANLNLYSPDKPLIGSLYELAWAYDQSHTMVIGIANEELGNSYILNHPFIRQSIDILARDEYQACELIKNVLD